MISAPRLKLHDLRAFRAHRPCPEEPSRQPKGATAIVSAVLVYAIIDLRSSRDHPLGDAVETFVRREDAERAMTARYLHPTRQDLEAALEALD